MLFRSAIEAPPRHGEGSTLAQQLQHSLRGLALVGLHQQGWERVVALHFARRPAEPCQRTLVLELMGRHSNLFLLDGERRVVAAARQVRDQQSRQRPIATGDRYSPPPTQAGRPPDSVGDMESWRRELLLLPLPLRQALQSSFQAISPALALQLAGDAPGPAQALLNTPVTALTPEQWQALWGHWRGWLAALQGGHFGFSTGGASAYRCWGAAGASAGASPLPINAALASYHRQLLLGRALGQRQQQLQQRLQQALQREHQQRQQQHQLLDQVGESDGLQRQADALFCLPQPSREQVAEAQALYKRARKLRRSGAAIEARLALHQQRIDQLEASLTFLELCSDADPAAALAQLQALEQDSQELLLPRHRPRRERPRPEGTPTPLELRSPSGLRLQVGRNHRQNDWISLRQARRGDLWFHAQECPGSHVVLKSSEGLAADGDLQAAADLAAHFSRARNNGRVAVLMVAADSLQRIPGAGPGTVRHRGGELLWGEPHRAGALLAAAAPSLSGEPQP